MELSWPSLLKNSSVQKIKMLWKHLSPNKVQLLLLLTLDRIVSVCNMAGPTASNMQNIAETRSREEGVTPPLIFSLASFPRPVFRILMHQFYEPCKFLPWNLKFFKIKFKW